MVVVPLEMRYRWYITKRKRVKPMMAHITIRKKKIVSVIKRY